ncbi:hypothetical protein EYF80_026064 [Liparis tanakae]|uniref:Uncharacterized protein n=1 Tax=Liparis tanakae TaxID=230148 RepID=A0A4Z2HCZ3_9TELE|nr:hypothetical protein EYF80_026064 [Liparis tanakae]
MSTVTTWFVAGWLRTDAPAAPLYAGSQQTGLVQRVQLRELLIRLRHARSSSCCILGAVVSVDIFRPALHRQGRFVVLTGGRGGGRIRPAHSRRREGIGRGVSTHRAGRDLVLVRGFPKRKQGPPVLLLSLGEPAGVPALVAASDTKCNLETKGAVIGQLGLMPVGMLHEVLGRDENQNSEVALLSLRLSDMFFF